MLVSARRVLTQKPSRALRLTPVAAVLLVAGAALAKVPAALDRVPKNAVAVIATDNFQRTADRIKTFASKIQIEQIESFEDVVEEIGNTPGFKKDGSVALVLLPEPKDVQPAGEGKKKKPKTEPMERSVLLAQTDDYKKMVTEMGGDASAKVAKVTGMGDEEMYARDIGGGWIVLGGTESIVSSFEPGTNMLKAHEEALGTVGNRAVDSSDIILIANMDALAGDINAGIDEMINETKKGGPRGGMGNPMFAAISPEAMKQFITPLETVGRAFARDAQTCVFGIGLADTGLTIDLGAQFKPKSEIAGFFQTPGKADATLASLSNAPYLFALSLDTTSPGLRQIAKNTVDIADKMIATAKDEMNRQAKQDESKAEQLNQIIKQIEGQTAGLKNFAKTIDKLDGVDAVWGFSPAMLAGAGLFSGVTYQARGSDPAAIKAIFKDQLKSMDAMAGPMKIDSTFTDNAAEVAGVKLDRWTMKPKMDPNDPMAGQMAMLNMFIFGATGQMSGFMATTKNSVIMTYTPNEQVMQTALDAANGKGTLAEDKSLAIATAPLPKNCMIRGVIGTKSLFDLAQMGLSFTGNPAQLKVPADVPPMAFGVTGDGGGTHIRFHAPISVITAISDAAKQFRGGEGDEGGDAEAPAEKKKEKPRF
ncbi:MAG: hypothetical protein K2Y21_06425 [Phycisphaerales bacterium]|nr:hypothetical protein [Phycisphaerales bacterium]